MHIRFVRARLAAAALLVFAGVAFAPQGTAHAQQFGLNPAVFGLPQTQIDLSVPASRRYAVVIGNGAYDSAPDLPNANADARLVAAFLRAQGYEVIEQHDLTKRGFEDLMRRILVDVTRDSEVVFYFAGHGLQIGAGNYIVPVDASLSGAYDVPFETVSLQSLVQIIGARARVQMIILDSCRDNPFENRRALTGIGNELAEARDGFSTQSAPVNSLLVFSTSPGAVALDGEGENSPFTTALIEAAAANPDASVSAVLETVRRSVYETTGGQQVPWESSTLVEQISFGQASFAASLQPVTAAGGATRTLASVAEATTQAVSESARQADLVLHAQLSPEVEIGGALRQALGLGPDDLIEFVSQPGAGRLTLIGTDGARQPVTLGAGSPVDADQIVYANAMPQTAAAQVSGPVFADEFVLRVNDTESTVRVTLEGHECDMQAGDHLDPDGSGLTRFANEIEPETALAACTAAIADSPETGRFHYQLGRAHLALRQFDEAGAAFERARDLGHVRAWLALGGLIASAETRTSGVATGKHPDAALAHYIIGVEQGDPYAFYALGRQLMRYETNPDLRQQGFDLMMRALEVGHTFAMNELGFFYLDQNSDFYDAERGLRYLRESAARDDIYGFNNMGLVYLNGLGGVAPDAGQAAMWFTRAAEGGHPIAATNLAEMYDRGLTGSASERAARALEWYEIGLARGDAWGGLGAAGVILNNAAPDRDAPEAARLLALAAALNDADATQTARGALGSLGNGTLDTAAQRMIAELGGEIEIDGAYGPGSQAVLAQVAARFGVAEPPLSASRTDRLVFLAGLYWQTTAFRVDLY